MSNASTVTSQELRVARSTSEEDVIRGARAAAFGSLERHPVTGPAHGPWRTAARDRPHLPTPRPSESLASRMAQQRRNRMQQRLNFRKEEERLQHRILNVRQDPIGFVTRIDEITDEGGTEAQIV